MTPAVPPSKRKVMIDQDALGPGGSNLQSILMILQSPDVEVLGITIESGDGWQKENVAHALRLLELIGRTEVPVVPGATYPLINSQARTRRWETLHGKLPYKGAWMEVWPSTTRSVELRITRLRSCLRCGKVTPPSLPPTKWPRRFSSAWCERFLAK